ncbi:MAG: mechanosensitive ion channel [Theionarchaea archaeon]|nr:mechanosensitive ion channel [Theionarchaea archaeon]
MRNIIVRPMGNEDTSGTVAGKETGKKVFLMENSRNYLEMSLEILSLLLILKPVWDVTQYTLEKSSEIIGLSFSEIWGEIRAYLESLDLSQVLLHAVIIIALVLFLYIILNLFCWISGKLENGTLKRRYGALIIFFFADLFLCFIFIRSEGINETIGKYKIEILRILVVVLSVYWIIEFREKIKNYRKIPEALRNYLVDHCWTMGLLFYSLFFYFVACFIFTEFKTGDYLTVFILPLIAFAISIGFFVCAVVFQRIVAKNAAILKFLKVSSKEEREDTIEKIHSRIDPLLANFLVAISSYVFLKAIMKPLIPAGGGEPQTFLAKVDGTLSIILLIPLYLFFYQVISLVLQKVYDRLYTRLEPGGLTPLKPTRIFVVNIFVELTKILFVAFVILNILHDFWVFDPIMDVISKPPISAVIVTGIAIPIVIWVSVLVIDPFYQTETIKIGSDTGKIRKIGILFTNLETMNGEQVYVPNTELLTKTIKRLKSRKLDLERNPPQELEQKGEGMRKENTSVIHFSCTLTYGYRPKDIKYIFKSLFKEEENGLVYCLRNAGFKIRADEMNYIFSEESRPFVFIEDFKDYGVTYRFNFRVIDTLYAPLLRSYFMEKFKEEMENDQKAIVTPVKFEIKSIGKKEFKW